MAEIPEYGTVAEVARRTRISVSTLNRWRTYQPEASPPFARFGRKIRYPLTGANSLETWAESKVAGAAQ